jgi:hypothetical protein
MDHPLVLMANKALLQAHPVLMESMDLILVHQMAHHQVLTKSTGLTLAHQVPMESTESTTLHTHRAMNPSAPAAAALRSPPAPPAAVRKTPAAARRNPAAVLAVALKTPAAAQRTARVPKMLVTTLLLKRQFLSATLLKRS